MTYELFFSGVGATLLGTLVGAWISCRLTYGFQQRLLKQQLEFQKALLEQQLAAEQKSHEEYLKVLKYDTSVDAQGGLSLRTVIHENLSSIKQAIIESKLR
jgi:hypothetical protein